VGLGGGGAARLAHEIKNPLTPIQLAAERLQMKLAGELNACAGRRAWCAGASTIVNQVAAMKRMVDEFSRLCTPSAGAARTARFERGWWRRSAHCTEPMRAPDPSGAEAAARARARPASS